MENEKLQQQLNQAKLKEVSNKLQTIEELKNTLIDVSLKQNGIVVLNGTISRYEHHGLATKLAAEIPGVFYVENNLAVDKGRLNA